MNKELAIAAMLALSVLAFASHSEAEVSPPGEPPGGIITPPAEPPELPQDDSGADIPQVQAFPAPARTSQYCFGLIYLPGQGLVYLPGFEPYGWFGVNQGCARFPIAKLSS